MSDPISMKPGGVPVNRPPRKRSAAQTEALKLAGKRLPDAVAPALLAPAVAAYLGARREALARQHGAVVGYIVDDEILDLLGDE